MVMFSSTKKNRKIIIIIKFCYQKICQQNIIFTRGAYGKKF